ncbi:MAG TPA: DUF2934 domain-containing protein [Bryobacteraceae bacterium]|nr:DUF2934 domain-containing protein [Bryobacteraceae bacterium]
MRSSAFRPVPVRSVDPRHLQTKLDAMKDRIRGRAYSLYCRRGGAHGDALHDWILAEHESNLAPLAGVTEDEREIRITAFVPGVNVAELSVDILPGEIVLETDREGKIERLSRFPLSAPIEPDRVEARLRGSDLEIVAPKANCG